MTGWAIGAIAGWLSLTGPWGPLPQGLDLPAAVREDPRPPSITRDTHYYTTNEARHDHFRGPVGDLGGVLVGVGTDQNFLLSGWAKPELLVLMDFDQAIVNLHGVYRLAFLEAETPQDFLALWTKTGRRRLRELIQEAPDLDAGARKATLKTLSFAGGVVNGRLKQTLKDYNGLKVPTYLSDHGQYQVLRDLFREGRVFAIRGDLTGPKTMKDLGRTLKAHGLKVRALYVSNAEQYFTYTQRFRTNIAALPFDDRSLVLRTRARGKDYVYVTQGYGNFVQWLAAPHIRNVRQVASLRGLARRARFLEVTAAPP